MIVYNWLFLKSYCQRSNIHVPTWVPCARFCFFPILNRRANTWRYWAWLHKTHISTQCSMDSFAVWWHISMLIGSFYSFPQGLLKHVNVKPVNREPIVEPLSPVFSPVLSSPPETARADCFGNRSVNSKSGLHVSYSYTSPDSLKSPV